ncbi:sigma-70 family RNA polymerase sigma factor [Dactylosporangium sp. CA-139066]|uniref:sigma-70 family RNA polymerase sigma factor n=1 Tax=Dactylosporangium sp. CA-139066 TaxID=3239930 RepID=UPI003D919847
MRTTGTTGPGLVEAARAGDRHALDELMALSLPIVYTIVHRALDGHPDADDVVQDTMLRVVRQLPSLQSAQRYRAWLAAIAVHQVSTHLHRRDVADRRAAPLEAAAAVPADGAPFEELTAVRLLLSQQRRQAERAAHWLDPDDRALLSLWWLEAAGELSRTELADALHVSVAHAGVRVQRMRQQLDLSREIVAALEARPRCAQLEAVVAEWGGAPGPLWRKRIARHTRSCPTCGRAAQDMIPAERLLAGLALLPVPIGLAAALLGRLALGAAAPAGAGVTGGIGAGTQAGLLSQLLKAFAAHPVAAAIAGAVTAGAVVTVAVLPAGAPTTSGLAAAPSSAPAVAASAGPPDAPSPPRPPRSSAAAPSPTRAPTLAPGHSVSLESAEVPGRFVTAADGLGVLTPLGPTSADAARRPATFAVVAGLADPACVSFRGAGGGYLRHASWRLRLNPDEGTPLFRSDATFCPRPGAARDSVLLESSNYPGWFVHARGDELWVDQSDNSAAFRAASSFWTRAPLAP